MTVDLTCAESRNDVARSAARIRKIIISNRPDRPRLKMSSRGRLVGQTLSSIILARRGTTFSGIRLPSRTSRTTRGLSSEVVKTCQPISLKVSPRGVRNLARCTRPVDSILSFSSSFRPREAPFDSRISRSDIAIEKRLLRNLRPIFLDWIIAFVACNFRA